MIGTNQLERRAAMLPSIFLGLIAGLFTTSAKRGAMAGAVVGVAIALLYVSAARGE